jgi:4-hydroxybenzoate polyprenyltransferase
MLIMPLVDLYATACDWMPPAPPPEGAASHTAGAGAITAAPSGLIWFLIVSFLNGMVIEIGRKIRAPEAEEQGVRTYSVLWGRTAAVTVWLGIMAATGALGVVAASRIDFTTPAAAVFVFTWVASAAVALRFMARPTRTGGKLIEAMAGMWTLALYLTLGAAPMIVRGV